MAQFIGFGFQVSGFNSSDPDTRNLTPDTFVFLQHVVRKKPVLILGSF